MLFPRTPACSSSGCRRPRRARASRDTIKDRASIHDRPKTIESRSEAGHWEATSSSANAHGLCSSCMRLVTGHARRAAHRENRRRNHLSDARGVRPHLRRSITFDNDTVFAQHRLLRTMRDMATWFCDAYASWQKGRVEKWTLTPVAAGCDNTPVDRAARIFWTL